MSQGRCDIAHYLVSCLLRTATFGNEPGSLLGKNPPSSLLESSNCGKSSSFLSLKLSLESLPVEAA